MLTLIESESNKPDYSKILIISLFLVFLIAAIISFYFIPKNKIRKGNSKASKSKLIAPYVTTNGTIVFAFSKTTEGNYTVLIFNSFEDRISITNVKIDNRTIGFSPHKLIDSNEQVQLTLGYKCDRIPHVLEVDFSNGKKEVVKLSAC